MSEKADMDILSEGDTCIKTSTNQEHFNQMVNELAERPMTMNMVIENVPLSLTIEHLNPEQMKARANEGKSIFVDIRGSDATLEVCVNSENES